MAKTPQCASFVQSDVVGPVTFDLVLRISRARVMDVAFVIHVFCVHPYDAAADAASLGIPAHVIANLECPGHDVSRYAFQNAGTYCRTTTPRFMAGSVNQH